MGRITIFSLSNCRHCHRAKTALSDRDIPFTEISLSTHPDKRADMLNLSDQLTVPQCFFNEKHVGGADDLIATLDAWEKEKKYPTARDYFAQEILPKPDPVDARLEIPTTPPVVMTSPPPPRTIEKCIKLPDGDAEPVSVYEMTMILRGILPKDNLKYNLTVYKDSFIGPDGIRVLQKHFKIGTEEEALAFGNRLVEAQIIKHVVGEHNLKNGLYYYRLQCFDQPDVLNSFRIWTERVDEDSMALLKRLKNLLGEIESAVTSNDGLVDYKKACKTEQWSVFEEAVCELQGVHLQPMPRDRKLAFGINLYNLMIKYAFMKVGISCSASTRGPFFSGVKMNVGGHIMSFNDLEHGVLRGNAKPAYSLSPQFSSSDPRARLAIKDPDCRIHFALNCGAKSCPSVQDVTEDALENELRIFSQAFCEQDENVKVDESNHSLHLTMLLSWYRGDFVPSAKELPAKVVTYLRGEKKETLQRMIDSGKTISVQFNTYDWSTNASEFVPFEKSVLVANDKGLRAMVC